MDSAVEPERSTGTGRRPEGRYGRSQGDADARADRRLRTFGAVLGVVLLGVVGWFGWHYVSGQQLSGEIIKFKAVSDRRVEVHLEVRKDADATGYCTLRSRSAEGAEVGRADFRFDEGDERVDRVVTLRTTQRATSAELVGCRAD